MILWTKIRDDFVMDPNRNVKVICPVCESIKIIGIPEKIFSQKRFGTIKVQVPKGGVCPDHQFIVLLDAEGIIRGYVKIDLQMETPKDSTKFSLHGLIKMFGQYGLFSLIHAKIFNYLSFIIRDEDTEDQSEIINKLGESLLPEKYQGMNFITFLEINDYSKIKKDKNILIMDNHNNILQTPWKVKLKFEEDIIKKALNISNEEEQRLIIQKEIAEFIKEVEFSREVAEKGDIYTDDLEKRISIDLMKNVDFYRITLIQEFIKRRISLKLSKKIKNRVDEFLSLL